MSARCPSDLALEAYLLEPTRSPATPHVSSCAACTSRIARMQAEGEDFRRSVFPATVEAIEEAAAPRRRRLLGMLVPIGGFLATAAAVILVLRTAEGPPADYVGLKGQGMSLSVYVGAQGGATAVADGATVPADAALRFKVRPAPDCRLWILSVDGAGGVSRLFPASGAAVPVGALGPLPGGAVLDGVPGLERIYAVCSPEPLPFEVVEGSAREVAAGGPNRLRVARALGGLPADVSQASVLLDKKAP